MKQNPDTVKVFSRRAFVIGGLQASLLAVLGGRLAYLQVSQGHKYKMLADKNRISIKMLPPERGEVVDRYGVSLASNKQNFRALIVTEQAKDVRKSLTALQKIIDLDDADIEDVVQESKRRPKFASIEIKDNLSWQEVSSIEVNLTDLPGISTGVGSIRTYPFADATAHIVGYVGAVNKQEINTDPVLSMPGFKIGKTGIEKRFEKELRGAAGAAEVEVNVSGREVRELQRKDSQAGKRVTLSIDGELQRYAQERLSQERSGSAVIMDVHTGAVYALASHPAFDPNDFTNGLSLEKWESLLADAAHPLTNKAIAGQYPPASTFKMVTLMAGLKSGVIKKDTVVHCSGHYEYGSDRFHCWKASGHGWVDAVKALSHSCDTYFYELSTKIGIDNMAAMARELGLGDTLGFDLPQERPGLVPDKNWKMANRGQKWRPGETIIHSIGQGYFQATPLQLAVMTARLVNGGYAVHPWVTGYLDEKPFFETQWPKLSLSDSHMRLVKKGMDEAVNNAHGTAYGSRIDESQFAFAGKTGTAQVRKITSADRSAGIKNEDLIWQHRHHALFVGYAPLHAPRYAVSVVIEHGIGGSRTAAPIARDLLLEVQKRAPAQTKILVGAKTPLKKPT